MRPRRRRVGRNGPAVRVSSPGGAGLRYLGPCGSAEDFSGHFGEDRANYSDPVSLPLTVTRAIPAGGSVIIGTIGLSFGSSIVVGAEDSQGNDYRTWANLVYDKDVTAPFDSGNVLAVTQGYMATALEPGDTISPFWRVGFTFNGLPTRVAAYCFAYTGIPDGGVVSTAGSADYPGFHDDGVCTWDALWGQRTYPEDLSWVPADPQDPVGARLMFSVLGIDSPLAADEGGHTLTGGFDHWKTDGYETLHTVFTDGDFEVPRWHHVFGHRLTSFEPGQHDPGGCWTDQGDVSFGWLDKGMCAVAFSAAGVPGTAEFGSPLRGVVGDRRATVGLRPQTKTPATI